MLAQRKLHADLHHNREALADFEKLSKHTDSCVLYRIQFAVTNHKLQLFECPPKMQNY